MDYFPNLQNHIRNLHFICKSEKGRFHNASLEWRWFWSDGRRIFWFFFLGIIWMNGIFALITQISFHMACIQFRPWMKMRTVGRDKPTVFAEYAQQTDVVLPRSRRTRVSGTAGATETRTIPNCRNIEYIKNTTRWKSNHFQSLSLHYRQSKKVKSIDVQKD